MVWGGGDMKLGIILESLGHMVAINIGQLEVLFPFSKKE